MVNEKRGVRDREEEIERRGGQLLLRKKKNSLNNERDRMNSGEERRDLVSVILDTAEGSTYVV